MPDHFIEACKTQLKIDAATVRNVRNIRWSKSATVREFGTSTSACANNVVTGRVTSEVTFDVVLADEEMIYDIIDVKDEVTLAYEYYLADGTLKATRSIPVVITQMSDEHNIDEGGEVTCTVTARGNGSETYT